MLIVKLLRLLTGYVCFSARGGFPERFVNLCSLSGVPLWDLTRQGGITFASTTASGYLRIKACAVRSGMRLKISSKHGLPFFVHKYRRRAGLLCGLAFFFCALGILSSMVWTVDITGNNSVTEEQVLTVLAQAGLKPGIFGGAIDAPRIRFYALAHLPDVTYITINRIGSSVLVDVTERVEQPSIPSDSTPCDVVSAVDGQIAVLEVYEGTKLHEPGDAIMAGEALAGGFVELRDGSVRFRHAQAYAIIRTDLIVDASCAKVHKTSVVEYEKKKITLSVFGFNIPLPGDEPELPCITRRRCLTIGGVSLPFGYTVKLYRRYAEKERKPDKSELALDIVEKFSVQKVSVLGGAEIINEKFSVTDKGKSLTAHGEYLAQISAGISQEMLVE